MIVRSIQAWCGVVYHGSWVWGIFVVILVFCGDSLAPSLARGSFNAQNKTTTENIECWWLLMKQNNVGFKRPWSSKTCWFRKAMLVFLVLLPPPPPAAAAPRPAPAHARTPWAG